MAYQWFYQRNDAELGPISSKDLLGLAQQGHLLPTDLVRRADMEKWTPAGSVKGLEFSRESASSSHLLANGFGTTATSAGQHLAFAMTDSGRRVELLDDGRWKDAPLITTSDNLGVPTVQQTKQHAAGGPHFRKASWGMSEREIRDLEPGEPSLELDSAIAYDRQIAELNARAVYIFAQGMLVRTKYIITEVHSNDNAFLHDYEKLKELLVQKYGRPVASGRNQSDLVWLNDLYQDDEDEWGTAVAAGHLVCQCNWLTSDTEILLTLKGDNYEVSLDIQYSSTSLVQIEREQKRRQSLDDL